MLGPMLFGVTLCLLGAAVPPRFYTCADHALEYTSGLELDGDTFELLRVDEEERAELWEYVDLETEPLERAA